MSELPSNDFRSAAVVATAALMKAQGVSDPFKLKCTAVVFDPQGYEILESYRKAYVLKRIGAALVGLLSLGLLVTLLLASQGVIAYPLKPKVLAMGTIAMAIIAGSLTLPRAEGLAAKATAHLKNRMKSIDPALGMSDEKMLVRIVSPGGPNARKVYPDDLGYFIGSREVFLIEGLGCRYILYADDAEEYKVEAPDIRIKVRVQEATLALEMTDGSFDVIKMLVDLWGKKKKAKG